MCKLCAGSLKFQDLSFKDNNYHVYHTNISRAIISDPVKYSGSFGGQHYCYTALLFGCELKNVSNISVYLSCLITFVLEYIAVIVVLFTKFLCIL